MYIYIYIYCSVKIAFVDVENLFVTVYSCHSCLWEERGYVGMLSNLVFIRTGVSQGRQERR